MPKKATLLRFTNIQLLWQFVQRIKAVNLEINTQKKTLLCDCSEEDLLLLSEYKGEIIESTPVARLFSPLHQASQMQ